MFGSVHPYHSSLTVLMSHYEYDEWSDRAVIEIHSLIRSLQADFGVMGEDNIGSWSIQFSTSGFRFELW